MTFIFTHRGEDYEGQLVTHHRYNDNGNIAVRLLSRSVGSEEDEPWEMYATLSVNTDVVLPEGLFVFKTYSENAGLYEEILQQRLIKPTGDSVVCGFAGPQPIVELVTREIPA